MNVFQRTRNALRGANAGWRYPSKATRRRRKPRTVLMWPDWRNQDPQWVLTDLSSYIDEGFELNAIIYSAIMFKVRTAYAALLRAYTGTRDEPELLPAGSDLGNLLDRPNKHQSYPELQAEMLVNFNLFGNAYVWFRRQAGEEFPIAFYNVRPDRVIHLYDESALRGYLFVPQGMTAAEGVPLLPGDTMHIRLPNPADPYMGLGKGLSPIKPLAQSGDVDNAATSFLKVFFDQGTMPMGMFTTDAPLSDTEIDEAKEVFLSKYGNWQQWIEPLFLSGDAKYVKLGADFEQLDLVALDARNESRIVMPFGVKLSLIESRAEMVQATYNNLETDYKMFLANTLIPELQMFQEEWRYFLRSEDGREFAQYDFQGIPGYFDQRLHIEDMSAGWQAGAVQRGEYRQALGLPVTEADNVYLLHMTQIYVPAASTALAPQTETGAASAEDEEGAKALNGLFGQPALVAGEPVLQSEVVDTSQFTADTIAEYIGEGWKHLEAKNKATDAQRQALGQQMRNTASRWEPKAQDAAQAAFRHDQREIGAIVDEAQRQAYRDSASVSWSLVLGAVTGYLQAGSKENWRDKFGDVLAGVALTQGQALSKTFEQEFAPDAFLAEEWFGQYEMIFADPLTATSERELAAIFDTAMAEGWSVPATQSTLGDLFQQWIDGDTVPADDSYFATQRLPPWRAEMIARTEMIRASNAAADSLYRSWGVAEKEWLATLDGRVRDAHAAAHGQVVGIDESFDVGGEALRFPGDPRGSPANVIQCRCTVLPRI